MASKAAAKKATAKSAPRKSSGRAGSGRKETVGDPPTRSVGAPGTIFSNGFQLFDDLNREWSNPFTRFKHIENMRKTDGQVQAALLACKYPLLASRWLVQPPDDPSEEEQFHADFVKDNIEQMDQPWPETLWQILTMIEFGHSVFEKIYRDGPPLENGRPTWYWKSFEPRMQKTIQEWRVTGSGRLTSILQRAWKGDGGERDLVITADRLLVFTIGKEGANYQGTSLLRSAFKHFVIKDGLYRIDAIAQERHGVGIPIIEPPGQLTAGDERIIEDLLKDLRSHEKSYVLLPNGYKLSMLEFKTQMRNPMESIKHHDEKIATSVLAQFINLGFSATGSRSLGQSFADFFMASLNYYASMIASVINEHAVRELIDVNFGVQKRYPRLECVPIGGIDFLKRSQAIMMLAQNGLVRTDQAVIENIHTMLGLPKPNWDKPAINVRPDKGTRTRSSSSGKGGQKNSTTKKTEPQQEEQTSEERVAMRKLARAMRLQMDVLLKPSNFEGVARFRPPLKGTLAEAISIACGERILPDLAEKVAVEISRRMTYTAEWSYATGGREAVATALKAEIARCSSLLLAVIRSCPEEEVDAA